MLFICEQYQRSNTKLGGFVFSINLFICCTGTFELLFKKVSTTISSFRSDVALQAVVS
jgi:hypothetical protein